MIHATLVILHLSSYTDHISPVKHYPGKDKDSKEGDSKKKTVKSAKSKKEPETPIIPVSDGEFKEKQPPKSLVAMHKDNIDSSVSITKKKGSQSGIITLVISPLLSTLLPADFLNPLA